MNSDLSIVLVALRYIGKEGGGGGKNVLQAPLSTCVNDASMTLYAKGSSLRVDSRA